MDITFDANNDVAQISLLTSESQWSKAERSVILLDTHVGEDIVLDFDDEGHLIGLEFLTARRNLRPDILEGARRQD